jgi:GTP-dependent phosphoenolpyruvate carboxykinase
MNRMQACKLDSNVTAAISGEMGNVTSHPLRMVKYFNHFSNYLVLKEAPLITLFIYLLNKD